MTASSSDARRSARLSIVDHHVMLENQHDLDAIMGTFGTTAHYDDEPWDLHYAGRDAVRGFYQELLRAIPDLCIDIARRHAGDAAVILEVVIRGRHLGKWRGLPPTGARLEFPLCAIFTFDDEDRLARGPFEDHRADAAADVPGVPAVPDGAVDVAEHAPGERRVEEQRPVVVRDGLPQRQPQPEPARHEGPAPGTGHGGQQADPEGGEERTAVDHAESVQERAGAQPPRQPIGVG